MNKYIIIVISALCLCSCKSLTDYSFLTVMTIKNDSSHTVTVETDTKYFGGSYHDSPLNATILSESSYSTQKIIPYTPGLPINFIGERCIITFDDNIEVAHSHKTWDKLIEHNMCDVESYTLNKSKDDSRHEYIYTFTDEDYERAVAANAEREE